MRHNLGIKLILLGFIAGILFVFASLPPVYKMKYSGLIRLGSGQINTIFVGPKTKYWLPLNEVSWHAIHAVLVAEDARFFEHTGLDLVEIRNSFLLNSRKGRIVRGASTITQQVVKLAFLTSERSIFRKFREAVGAIALELLLSKEEILTWYMNIVPLGIVNPGYKAASKFYFNKNPAELTISESIMLATIIPRPTQRSRQLLQRKLSKKTQRRYQDILNKMLQNGFITEQQQRYSLAIGDFGKPIEF